MKRRIAWLLALCLLAGALAMGVPPVGARAENVLDEGVDENIRWKFVGRPNSYDPTVLDKVLVLSGTGPMKDYSFPYAHCKSTELPPWNYNPTYNPDVGSVYGSAYRGIEFEPGITHIGSYAFYAGSHNQMDRVAIPDTVTSIGKCAFAYQDHLDVLIVPASVTSIGESAFHLHTVIECEKGSAVWQYCQENGYRVSLIGEPTATPIPTPTASPVPTPIPTATPAREVTVSYALNGGTNAAANPRTLTVGESVALKAAKRKGYLFAGWMCGGRQVSELTADSADASGVVKLTAKWEKVKVGKVKSLKLTGKKAKQLTAGWARVSGAAGYEVQYCLKKTFPAASTKTVKATAAKATVKGLRKARTWYVRVRAWKKDSAGKKVYGKWSKVGSVKVK